MGKKCAGGHGTCSWQVLNCAISASGARLQMSNSLFTGELQERVKGGGALQSKIQHPAQPDLRAQRHAAPCVRPLGMPNPLPMPLPLSPSGVVRGQVYLRTVPLLT